MLHQADERIFGPYWSVEASPIGYRNAEMAPLLATAKETADPDARDRIYGRLAPIVLADAPITFLFPSVTADAVHRRARGLASPFRGDPVTYTEDLWLEDGARDRTASRAGHRRAVVGGRGMIRPRTRGYRGSSAT